MTWYIQDYDETLIYITDDWREFYIPKFRISMTVSGDELRLAFHDRERGGGGDERPIIIDYKDVASGYGGFLNGASSAQQLKEAIEAMIVSAWTDIPQYTDEQAQDAVGSILNTDEFTYDDATPEISLNNVFSYIIGYSGTVVATSTTAEEILWSVVIPGGTIGAGDAITPVFGFNKVAGGGTTGVRVRLHTSNAVAGTEYYVLGMTGTTKRLETVNILMTGATAQIGNPAIGQSFGQFGVAFGASSLDTANDIWVIFTSQKSVAADTQNLQFAYVEIKKYRA